MATPLPYPIFRELRPVALRPTLSRGLPFSSKNYCNEIVIVKLCCRVNDAGHGLVRQPTALSTQLIAHRQREPLSESMTKALQGMAEGA